MTRARDLADYISTGVSDTELDVLDGVTAGTVTASKALVVDANKDIASLRNITATGTVTGNVTGDVTGNVTGNVSGSSGSTTGNAATATTAGTVTTAAQSNITSLGTLTALTVDDITIDGSTISDGGTLTIDVAGKIDLSADDEGNVRLFDGTLHYGTFKEASNNFIITSQVSDADLIFQGNDGGSTVTALTLDMSEAGKATFNSDVVAPRFVDSASSSYFLDPFGTSFLAYAYLQQSFAANSALSGTTPTITADTHSSFSLTTSGNTTFTFSVGSISTGYLIGFVLKLTSGGSHTITYPNTVDFAGGAAPDAPASGETDILVFTSIDGGTNWYGARAIDAAA
jgi:hypothetical protein